MEPHDGVVIGGWSYIWAAYAVVWGGMLIYGVSLYFRRRKAQDEEAMEAQQ